MYAIFCSYLLRLGFWGFGVLGFSKTTPYLAADLNLSRSPLPLSPNRNKVESIPQGDLDNTFDLSAFLDQTLPEEEE